MQDMEEANLSEPQKAHPTSEFIIVALNCGCYLVSRLANTVRVSEYRQIKFSFWLKIAYPAA